MSEKPVLENRIRGIEYEYAINTLPASDPHVLIDYAIDGMHRNNYVIRKTLFGKNTTANGGVVYNDLDHLEICTPSFIKPIDAVVYDKVGEIYAYVGALTASSHLKKDIFTHKTNISTVHWRFLGSEDFSYATHGNVCMRRDKMLDWEKVKKAFIPYIISRIVFTGTGDTVGGKFVISPRAMMVKTDSSEDTMYNRGIVNERNYREHLTNEKGELEDSWSRNYSNAFKYMRWHDIHFEGLRCFWSIMMRDIWQSYVASAFEEGLLENAPKISDPVKQFKNLSRDLYGNWKLDGEISGEVRKLDVVDDILGFYQDKFHKLFESKTKTQSDDFALKNVDLLMEKLRGRSLESFKNYGIDYLTKMDWLKEYGLSEPKSDTEIKEAERVCKAFSWIDSKVLHYLPADNRGAGISEESECLFDPEESMRFMGMEPEKIRSMIQYALNHPVEDTRDWFSWLVLKKFGNDVTDRTWNEIDLKTDDIILLQEPFMLNKSEVGYMENINTASELISMVKQKYPDYVTKYKHNFGFISFDDRDEGYPSE